MFPQGRGMPRPYARVGFSSCHKKEASMDPQGRGQVTAPVVFPG